MSLTPLVHVDQSLDGVRVGEVVALPQDQRHHLTRVLRLGVGEPLELSDGDGGHAAAELTDQGARLTQPPATVPRPQPRLRVVHALPKGRKLDEVIRTVVELGVDEVEPVTASRSVRRPEGARVDKAVQRWQAVARSACEQARRMHRVRIAPVVGVADLAVTGRWLLADPGAPHSLPQQLAGIDADALVRHDEPVTVAVGPEGGWTEQEIGLLASRGALPVHLGPTVLRTEHAAAAAVAVISATLGRWE
jgi:16S rRNA (uracil1498-N3)-methyltransferase